MRISKHGSDGTNSKRTARKPRRQKVAVSPDVKRILENLAGCKQTTLAQKTEFRDEIGKAVVDYTNGTGGNRVTETISSKLAKLVTAKGYFFKGIPSNFHSSRAVWNAKHAQRFKSSIKWSIVKANLAHGSVTTAGDDSSEIFAQLRDPDRWLHAVQRYSHLPIHKHGFPFWIADPKSGDPPPEARLDHYPARAGLAPDDGPGAEYILLRLRIEAVAAVPRFADSCGYVYWRPGGKTEPIPGCPRDLSGFSEAVTDGVTLGNIAAEPLVIGRCI